MSNDGGYFQSRCANTALLVRLGEVVDLLGAVNNGLAMLRLTCLV